MADWSGGYVTEVAYPYSYRGDMNLVRIRALLTLAGYVARQLAVGGAFVFSYNAMPGWATFVPVRDFMLGYADNMRAPSTNITNKRR